jgi:hypothetical protein
MANTLINSTWVLKDVGRGYENSVKFISNIRQYDNRYEFGGAKIGNTVLYRLPQKWVVADGQALQEQPILDQTVPISLTNQKHVDFGWSSAQATTEIEEVQKRYTKPAGATLAAVADSFAFAAVYKDVYNSVGTPGTTPSATLTYLQAGVKLADGGAPDDGLIGVLDTMAMATIANTSSTLFNPPSTISGNYRKGQFGGKQLGFDEWYRDAQRPTHVTGTFTASTPVVNGAGQTGSSLITSGWASGATTLKKGDTFTIAGVFGVNPLTQVSTGRLAQFVVTADISDTSGAITIPISPSIITSGAYATVSNSPANSAAITVWSANPAGGTLATTSSPQSLMFHPDAFAFVTADLELPIGGADSSRINSAGLAMRIARQWDVRTDQNITRIDMLIGAATLQPRLAVRVVG